MVSHAIGPIPADTSRLEAEIDRLKAELALERGQSRGNGVLIPGPVLKSLRDDARRFKEERDRLFAIVADDRIDRADATRWALECMANPRLIDSALEAYAAALAEYDKQASR